MFRLRRGIECISVLTDESISSGHRLKQTNSIIIGQCWYALSFRLCCASNGRVRGFFSTNMKSQKQRSAESLNRKSENTAFKATKNTKAWRQYPPVEVFYGLGQLPANSGA
jgi:hypothetical protein